MRLLLSVALFGIALAFQQLQDSRGCPYASRTIKKILQCPHSKSNVAEPKLGATFRRAYDKKGVVFMNLIAPGTSELYIANADGSDERKLLGNESTFDYHASFSPDGQWITFTTERHGDGNFVSASMMVIQHSSPRCARTSTTSGPMALVSLKSLQLRLSKTQLFSLLMAQKYPSRQRTTTKPTSGSWILSLVALSI